MSGKRREPCGSGALRYADISGSPVKSYGFVRRVDCGIAPSFAVLVNQDRKVHATVYSFAVESASLATNEQSQAGSASIPTRSYRPAFDFDRQNNYQYHTAILRFLQGRDVKSLRYFRKQNRFCMQFGIIDAEGHDRMRTRRIRVSVCAQTAKELGKGGLYFCADFDIISLYHKDIMRRKEST